MLLQGGRGPIISNERPKQIPMRGFAQAHPITPSVIRVPYPSYGPSSLTRPKFMELIPTPIFTKKRCLIKTYLKYVFRNVIFRLFLNYFP